MLAAADFQTQAFLPSLHGNVALVDIPSLSRLRRNHQQGEPHNCDKQFHDFPLSQPNRAFDASPNGGGVDRRGQALDRRFNAGRGPLSGRRRRDRPQLAQLRETAAPIPHKLRPAFLEVLAGLLAPDPDGTIGDGDLRRAAAKAQSAILRPAAEEPWPTVASG
jgi:hypothetical protein